MKPRLKPLFASLLLTFAAAPLFAAEETGAQTPPPGAVSPEDPLTYVGARTRIGIGYQSEDQLRGEGYHVFTEDAKSAAIGEAWVAGRDGNYAGGLKFSYHWLPETEAKWATSVRKAFLAVDQNAMHDRKLTLGGGYEDELYSLGAYLSGALTGRREIGTDSSSVIDTVQGTDNGRPFLQDITTTTTVRTFERAYDFGLGMRAGHFYEPALLRLTGGLDYEWGQNSAHQWTGSLMLEKFFYDSPHSLALVGEVFRKSGDYETTRDDHRVSLVWRYEFGGKSYRPIRESKVVKSERPAPDIVEGSGQAATSAVAEAKPRIEKRAVKVTASMSADAFFKFDSAQLTSEAKEALDGVVRTLKNTPFEGNILLTGHTCDIGPDDYNLKLSLRRANAVRKYLHETGGIAIEVLVAEGRGKADPRYPNKKATRYKNRRVDLEFVTYSEKLEDVILPPEPSAATPTPAPAAKKEPIIEWRREYLDTEPAWLRRALHNPVAHKQAVDVYRQQETEKSVAEGPRRYVNRPPVAVNDSFSVNQNSSANLVDVLANDSDPDGDALTITSATTPAHGTTSVSGGKVSYTPASGYSGADSFSYTISDGKGGTATATVSITVAGINHPPVANNDSYTVAFGSSNSVFDVLANDSDLDGDALTIASVTTPAHGTATISSGKVNYTPATGYSGADSFSYTISDGKGGSATANVSVTVQAAPGNHPPVANNDSYVVYLNQPITLNVLANDSDPDGNALTIVSNTLPPYGNLVLNSNGSFTFTLTNRVLLQTFTYTISDGHGGTATATVSLIDP